MTGRRGTVLVVEDDAMLALDLADLLTQAGYEVIDPAENNEVAKRALQRQRPAFALLDYNLGSETSIPTALELVQREIPFLYVTGRAEAILTNPLAPVARVLSKPYRAEDLLQAISELAA